MDVLCSFAFKYCKRFLNEPPLCTCLQGSIATVSVGEISCSLRESLSPILQRSGTLKVHIAIKDVEILLRPAVGSKKKDGSKQSRKASKQRSQHSSSGAWWFLSRILGLLHVTVTDVIFTSTKVSMTSKIWSRLNCALMSFNIERRLAMQGGGSSDMISSNIWENVH